MGTCPRTSQRIWDFPLCCGQALSPAGPASLGSGMRARGGRGIWTLGPAQQEDSN